jgi:DNA gyrase/topoisomerase IV subunit A
MDSRERQAAEERLGLLELLVAAQERRHDVLDAVWRSADEDAAAERLRVLLDVEDANDPRIGVVLDMQMYRLTERARAEISANIDHLRQVLTRSSGE